MKSPFLFTIIALPQYYQAGILRFNVVFIPRNISPINDLNAWGFPTVNPFSDAGTEFKLEANVIAGLDSLPDAANVTYQKSLGDIAVPTSSRPIFEALNLQFNGIDDIPNKDQTPPLLQTNKFIKKYLPISYRNAFNFTNPRTKDAVIDDSYHCAFKDKGNAPGFNQSSDRVSWGKVYAHCLRNPELAKKVGLIYTDLSIEVPEGSFENGGWLYVDFPDPDNTPHYYTDIQVNPTPIIKRYGARIPAMKLNEERVLFAPVLFPVAFGTPISGIYDDVQREAADYDNGFAKIVHLFQPISTNVLQEKQDQNTIPPTKDVGIRLGWDDEQVLIWQNRQLKADPSAGANQVLDAPLGVAKYYIDVRIKSEDVNEDEDWKSLNLVQPKAVVTLGGEAILNPTQQLELGTEVYPMQLSGDKNSNFWLPAYFTQWSGKSMVLPDEDAHAIYRIEEESRTYETGDNIKKDLKVSLARQYSPVGLGMVELRYGKTYEFRVRLGDISGGGPKSLDKRFFEPIAKDPSITFKRNVPPNAIRMEALPDNGAFYEEASIRIRRPIIEFPNVEFTGFYSDLVDKLISYSRWTEGKGVAKPLPTGGWSKGESYPVGLPDPDVDVVEITVEVKALQMDHKLSVSGKEPYYKLYTITRNFHELNPNAAVLGDPDELDPFQNIESPLELPIEFRDATVINFDENADFGEWPVTKEELETGVNVILPTGRDVRITLRPLGKNDPDYFGFEAWKRGKTAQFVLRQAPKEELNLFNPAFLTDAIKGIYLQTNKVTTNSGANHFLGSFVEGGPGTPIQRLAQQLKVQTKDNSLVAYPGIRTQFGCSRRVRHTLAPDGTSISFSTETDLLNHWLVCLQFELQRDWSWDAMDVESFVIVRSKKFSREETIEEEEIGSIDLHTTINLQALDNPIRSHTSLIFIDAVEPKKDPVLYTLDPFPDTIELSYRVIPQFKPTQLPQNTAIIDPFNLELPVTTIPIQEPKLASAGIALSPYRRDEKYANTEPRRKYLWFELKEPIQDPNDALFVRLLGYAPDPLLSDLTKYPELLTPPVEPTIAIDPEWIRVIRSGQADDHSGLNAMTEMEGAIVGVGQRVRHFIVPLPPGLHPDSDELFGFFTYELRIGHKHIWSTALGRFGRPLRVTGVQHPAPNLYCTVERTKNEIKVVAPYASAVHNAKNVTARPPRTELWTLLYAQVKMANNEDYRNILLGDLKMGHIIQRPPSYSSDILLNGFQQIASFNGRNNRVSGFQQMESFENSDKVVNGIASFPLEGVEAILSRMGLPLNSPLSVLTVEFLPTEYEPLAFSDQEGLIAAKGFRPDPLFNKAPLRQNQFQSTYFKEKMDGIPLSRDLGQYRILRTSPLVAVPEVCCEDC